MPGEASLPLAVAALMCARRGISTPGAGSRPGRRSKVEAANICTPTPSDSCRPRRIRLVVQEDVLEGLAAVLEAAGLHLERRPRDHVVLGRAKRTQRITI